MIMVAGSDLRCCAPPGGNSVGPITTGWFPSTRIQVW